MRNFAQYIECHITTVSIDSLRDRQNVTLTIVDHQGGIHDLIAESVDYFALDAMRLRNIIETISLYDNVNFAAYAAEIRKKIFYLLQGRELDDKDEGVLSGMISKLAEDIACGRKVLLEIVSLYGADLLLLSEKVSVVKHDFPLGES